MWCSCRQRSRRSRRHGKLFKFWSDHRVSTPHLNRLDKRMSVLKVSRKSVHNWQSYFTKCALVFGLRSTSDDRLSNPSKKCWPKHKKKQKRHPKASKNKCLFFDYVPLLMIGWVIWVVNGNWNAKKWPPKSSKNKMFIFWWSTRRLPEDHQKTVRRPAEDKQKTGRRQAEDYQKSSRRPAEDYQKTSRRLAEDHQTISWAIWAKNIEQNAKKPKRPPKSSKNKMFIFGLHSTSDDWPSDLSKKHQPKCTEMKKAP